MDIDEDERNAHQIIKSLHCQMLGIGKHYQLSHWRSGGRVKPTNYEVLDECVPTSLT